MNHDAGGAEAGLPLYCAATAGARVGVLHRPDLDSVPGPATDGLTICTLQMQHQEAWAAMSWQAGARACGVCCWDAFATALTVLAAEELQEALG